MGSILELPMALLKIPQAIPKHLVLPMVVHFSRLKAALYTKRQNIQFYDTFISPDVKICAVNLVQT
jgi:hypothetical protein